MSKGPDLSAFPIPRKGAARPIALEGSLDEPQREGEGASIEQLRPPAPASVGTPEPVQKPAEQKRPAKPVIAPLAPVPAPSAVPSGQMIATTVKLDESRYLRLAEAGRPAPGRLKRRTIQEIMVEALDEWFERRGL
jgi:hypothetical protein